MKHIAVTTLLIIAVALVFYGFDYNLSLLQGTALLLGGFIIGATLEYLGQTTRF